MVYFEREHHLEVIKEIVPRVWHDLADALVEELEQQELQRQEEAYFASLQNHGYSPSIRAVGCDAAAR